MKLHAVLFTAVAIVVAVVALSLCIRFGKKFACFRDCGFLVCLFGLVASLFVSVYFASLNIWFH